MLDVCSLDPYGCVRNVKLNGQAARGLLSSDCGFNCLCLFFGPNAPWVFATGSAILAARFVCPSLLGALVLALTRDYSLLLCLLAFPFRERFFEEADAARCFLPADVE